MMMFSVNWQMLLYIQIYVSTLLIYNKYIYIYINITVYFTNVRGLMQTSIAYIYKINIKLFDVRCS